MRMNIETVLKTRGNVALLDREILIAALLHKDRTWVLAHPETVFAEGEWMQLQTWLKRREKKEPIAYILGEKEFYGRMFVVNSHTLIPRPSTEGLTGLALTFLETGEEQIRPLDTDIVGCARRYDDLKGVATVADVGTGSGCIAITLALEQPDLRILATDIEALALETAKENARHYGVDMRIDFLPGSLLAPLADLQEPFIVVSNPPYIPEGEDLMEDVEGYEPHGALFAGKDGTDVLKALVDQSKVHPFCRGIVLECREEQVNKL